jgi:hypothetical protein
LNLCKNLKKMQVSKHEEAKIQKIMKKKWKKFWESYMHKDYFGNHIIEMFYVGHFIVLMITKNWFNNFSSHALYSLL